MIARGGGPDHELTPVADGAEERAREAPGRRWVAEGRAGSGRTLRGEAPGESERGECDGGARGRWRSGRRCGVEVGEEGAERSLFRRSRKDSVRSLRCEVNRTNNGWSEPGSCGSCAGGRRLGAVSPSTGSG
jgi:hypothetical protein